MEKEIKILVNFTSYILLGLFICLIGLSNVFADTYEDIGHLSDYSDVFVEVSYTGSPLALERADTYQLEQVEAMNIQISNFTFASGVTYSIEFSTPNTALSYANAFTVTGIDNNNKTVSCATVGITYDDIKYLNFRFNCSSSVNELYLRIFNSSNNYIMDSGIFSWSYVYLRRVTSSTDTSILESQNSQIIQGQEEIKDTIKDELNSCRLSKNILTFSNFTTTYNGLNVKREDGIVSLSGTATGSGDIDLGTYILYPGTYYQNLNGSNGSSAISVIRSLKDNSLIFAGNGSFTLIETTNVRFGIYFNNKFNGTYTYKPMVNEGTSSLPWEQGGIEICTNKIDETNQQLGDLNNNLTDSSPTDMSGLGDSAGWLPAGPVDSILTLPLTLFTTLSNNLSNNTCTTVVLTLPFINKNISLPCIKTLYDKIGITGTLFTTAGIIASCFILFNYLLSLYNWVDNTLTMRENNMPGYYDDNWGGGA